MAYRLRDINITSSSDNIRQRGDYLFCPRTIKLVKLCKIHAIKTLKHRYLRRCDKYTKAKV